MDLMFRWSRESKMKNISWFWWFWSWDEQESGDREWKKANPNHQGPLRNPCTSSCSPISIHCNYFGVLLVSKHQAWRKGFTVLIGFIQKIIEKVEARGKRTTLQTLENIYLSQVLQEATSNAWQCVFRSEFLSPRVWRELVDSIIQRVWGKLYYTLNRQSSCHCRDFVAKQSQLFILGDDDSVSLKTSMRIRTGECWMSCNLDDW